MPISYSHTAGITETVTTDFKTSSFACEGDLAVTSITPLITRVDSAVLAG